MSKQEELLDRKLKTIKIAQDFNTVKAVILKFQDAVDVSPKKGEDQSRVKKGKYGSETSFTPHDDFVNAMKALLQHAFDIMEMNVVKSEREDYAVLGVDIKGDLLMNQSRVTLLMGKRVHRSEKVVTWTCPEVTLSDESKYLSWKDFKKKLEVLIAEAWEYMKGKHADDKMPLAFQLQMPLFENEVEEEKEEELFEGKPKSKFSRRKKPVADPILPEMVVTGPQAIA